MIKIESEGDFKNLTKFLDKVKDTRHMLMLAGIERVAQEGVEALQSATPQRTGTTANSWSYEIEDNEGELVVYWSNDNIVDGVNIAVILQYGHATGTGGYVEGIDYIKPALEPIFDTITEDMWEVVTSS